MSLPRPIVSQTTADRILATLAASLPGFEGFRSGPFVEEERAYKLESSAFA